ncbi:hypothetical protein [Marinobacter sp. DUT-1]|uniref:hypothetical protein n=1 Tax=Marinobacter sp. DUT-1 TaxID=3412037 RepID=UPI003D16EBE1
MSIFRPFCFSAILLSGCASQPATEMSRDEVLSSRLPGTWECSLIEKSPDGNLSIESTDQYLPTGAANSFGSMTISGGELPVELKFAFSVAGTWEIMDEKLIVTSQDMKIKNVSHPEMDSFFNLEEFMPQGLSDASTIRVLTSEVLVLGIDRNSPPIDCSRIDG